MDYFIQNTKLFYITCKYCHTPMLYAKSLDIVIKYSVYLEYCEGEVERSWKVKKPLYFGCFDLFWSSKGSDTILLIRCTLEMTACSSQQNKQNESVRKWQRQWNVDVTYQRRGSRIKLISPPDISRWFPHTQHAHRQDYSLKSCSSTSTLSSLQESSSTECAKCVEIFDYQSVPFAVHHCMNLIRDETTR